jgi:fructosamine-3-kinase
MLSRMASPTQRELSVAEVAVMVGEAFGPGTQVADAVPLSGGGFGTVWRVDLAAGRRTVLKVGPAPAAKLLSYEAGMVGAEADYLRLVADRAPAVPTPRLLHQGRDWLFMTLVPGTPLPSLPAGTEAATVRYECGAAVARLHAVTGDRFGYTGPRPHAATWPAAFTAMVEALLDDAMAWGVPLPVEADRVRATVAAQRDLLATVTVPALVHFDLWDGNVLATADSHLAGLVDGERYLYGDPLIDFASPALFRDIFSEPDHPFVLGYRSVRPFTVDSEVRRRAWLYQLYLYLIMTVEFPSRGMSPTTHADRWARLARLLEDRLSNLDG